LGENVQNPLANLKDIKPLVEIPDYSLYLLIALIVVLSVILLLIAWRLFGYFKNRTNKSKRERALKILESLDLEDTKVAAYAITRYGKYLATEDRTKDIYKNLIAKLEKHKYRKESTPFERESIDYFHLFLEVGRHG